MNSKNLKLVRKLHNGICGFHNSIDEIVIHVTQRWYVKVYIKSDKIWQHRRDTKDKRIKKVLDKFRRLEFNIEGTHYYNDYHGFSVFDRFEYYELVETIYNWMEVFFKKNKIKLSIYDVKGRPLEISYISKDKLVREYNAELAVQNLRGLINAPFVNTLDQLIYYVNNGSFKKINELAGKFRRLMNDIETGHKRRVLEKALNEVALTPGDYERYKTMSEALLYLRKIEAYLNKRNKLIKI